MKKPPVRLLSVCRYENSVVPRPRKDTRTDRTVDQFKALLTAQSGINFHTVKTDGMQSEVRQLQNMISALRDELEKARITEDERLRKALSAADGENMQLRTTIVALRDEIERRQSDFRKELEGIQLAHQKEMMQLQETIVELRRTLEKTFGPT